MCGAPGNWPCILQHGLGESGQELIVLQNDLIGLTAAGVGPYVFDNLKAFLYTLFVAEVSKANTASIASSISNCLGKCARISHF